MSQGTSTQHGWSSAQIGTSASITRRLYRNAMGIVREDFDHDHDSVLIPAAILALVMVLDLHLSERDDRKSGGRHDQ